MLEPERADTIVGTADFVRAVNAIQYGIGQGRCITATMTGRTVRSGSLGREQQWRNFGPCAARLGVHSALALPLHATRVVIVSLNLYAYARDASIDHAAAQVHRYPDAVTATVERAHVAVQVARRLTQRGPSG